jgi:predicted transcriptional regulator
MVHEEVKRKTAAHIRNQIMKKLKQRPQGTTELARNLGVNSGIITNNLAWLEHIGVVSSYTTMWKGQEKRLWKLEK